jgi:hypothetical protein
LASAWVMFRRNSQSRTQKLKSRFAANARRQSSYQNRFIATDHKFMKWIIAVFITGISLALFTGCQTEEEQVGHTQDRQQEMLMQQMQKDQKQAEERSNQ